MEDAAEQLDQLARSVGECIRCDELVVSRLRAVPGGGHPHCAVMVVSLSSTPTDEEDGRLAGEALLSDLAEFMPALTASRDKVYVTALAKCVPRSDGVVRGPRPEELGACYPYLSKELTITTPHYVLTLGEETTRFLLGKLFKNRQYEPGDPLELRLVDSPSFKVVRLATPDELRACDSKIRKEYADRLRTLAQVMGL